YCSNACRQRAYRRRTAELAAERRTRRAVSVGSAGGGSAATRSAGARPVGVRPAALGSAKAGAAKVGSAAEGPVAQHPPGGRHPEPPGGAESSRVWRERQVASLVAQGLTNSQIARHVGASVRTVGADIAAACRRRGLRSRAQLA